MPRKKTTTTTKTIDRSALAKAAWRKRKKAEKVNKHPMQLDRNGDPTVNASADAPRAWSAADDEIMRLNDKIFRLQMDLDLAKNKNLEYKVLLDKATGAFVGIFSPEV